MGDSHSDAESVQTSYDWTNTTPSAAVIDAIASLENVKSVDLSKQLGTTLYDSIDPEALDTLIADGRPVSIWFTVGTYDIHIGEEGLAIYYE